MGLGSIKNTFISAYFAAWLAASVVVPLYVWHGYRQWWLVTFYAILVATAAAGSISHYRTARRNRKG
jgi:hypothetical protein